MNKLLFGTLAAAALLPLAAQAQDAKPALQGLTRAEVIAELQRSRVNGEFDRLRSEPPDSTGAFSLSSTSSRDEALRVAKQAKAAEKARSPTPRE